jgi:hypothetical protein
VVAEDGSPCGAKRFVLWNPPLKCGPLPHETTSNSASHLFHTTYGKRDTKDIEYHARPYSFNQIVCVATLIINNSGS